MNRLRHFLLAFVAICQLCSCSYDYGRRIEQGSIEVQTDLPERKVFLLRPVDDEALGGAGNYLSTEVVERSGIVLGRIAPIRGDSGPVVYRSGPVVVLVLCGDTFVRGTTEIRRGQTTKFSIKCSGIGS